jgi:hypothetical protein
MENALRLLVEMGIDLDGDRQNSAHRANLAAQLLRGTSSGGRQTAAKRMCVGTEYLNNV